MSFIVGYDCNMYHLFFFLWMNIFNYLTYIYIYIYIHSLLKTSSNLSFNQANQSFRADRLIMEPCFVTYNLLIITFIIIIISVLLSSIVSTYYSLFICGATKESDTLLGKIHECFMIWQYENKPQIPQLTIEKREWQYN